MSLIGFLFLNEFKSDPSIDGQKEHDRVWCIKFISVLCADPLEKKMPRESTTKLWGIWVWNWSLLFYIKHSIEVYFALMCTYACGSEHGFYFHEYLWLEICTCSSGPKEGIIKYGCTPSPQNWQPRKKGQEKKSWICVR